MADNPEQTPWVEKPPETPFPVVGIGASAGGLEAFSQLLSDLPADTGMVFVFVQHLDPGHESMLTQILARVTPMPVLTAADGMQVEPNHVYVIPPNTYMAIHQGQLTLKKREKIRGQYMPIDYFLRSLALERGSRSIAVILSGTGSDGALRIEEIKAEGGITFAQDQYSAKFDGMPRCAVSTDCVDFVLAPRGIAAELIHIGRHPYVNHVDVIPPEIVPADEEDQFAQIYAMLRAGNGVDFTQYKQSTIKRRILRRMVLHRLGRLSDYVALLRENPGEVEALYQDVLIKVTSFFRDPEVFVALKEVVFPALMKGRTPKTPLRIWVPGCSSGEEVYSIAIALLEYLGDKASNQPVQVFATDISEAVIEKARAGQYIENISADVSPERLRRFFVKTDAHYQISKSIRDVCVFARQNLSRDPPFSRLDLISCRNVLIYFDTAMQKRVFPIFYYALNPNCFLLLGTSESIGGFGTLFQQSDKKHKIFAKVPGVKPINFDFPTGDYLGDRGEGGKRLGLLRDVPTVLDTQKEADRIVVSKYAPPGVIVNENLDVLHFRGQTAAYLRPAPGLASFNVVKMAAEGLHLELRTALAAAKKDNVSVRRSGLRVKTNGGMHTIDLEVIPLKAPPNGERCFLILFEDADERTAEAAPRPQEDETGDGEESSALAREVDQLREELASTREYLQASLEEQEAVNEELKSANEEILSSNEELQSTNEELETAKEELQSANEELTTLNEELQDRNEELNRVNADLNNLLSNVSIPIIMLGRDLCVRRFTSLAERVFNLVASDIGRSIMDIKPRIDVPNLLVQLMEVIDTLTVKEREVQDQEGRWYVMRLRPYRVENQIDGVVMTFLDIDALKHSIELLKESRDSAEMVVQSILHPILLLDAELRVKLANLAFCELFRIQAKDAEGVRLRSLEGGSWYLPELIARLEDCLRDNCSFRDFEIEGEFPRIGRRLLSLSAQPVGAEQGRPNLIHLSIVDLTERHQLEERERLLIREQLAREQAELANHVKDEFLATLSHELRTPLNAILGWATLLKSGKLNAEESVRGFDTIERNVRAQVRLIEDLLDVSRILAGKIHLEMRPLDLRSVSQLARDSVSPTADVKQVRLNVQLPADAVWVTGDSSRLQQSITNLLSNAVKFTSGGGRVEVRLEHSDKEAVLSVRDTGVGIKPEFMPHVFERFRQADTSTTRAHGGLGLGLAITRSLMEMHGGSVRAESPGEGQGATFTLTLPLTAERPPVSTEPVESSGRADVDLRGCRVLIVDDEADLRQVMALQLRQCGAEVREAGSAAEAFAVVRDWRPHVLISDIAMPDEDGFSLIEKVRALDPGQGGETPAVALTVFARPEDETRILEAGFDGYLAKPVESDAFCAMVARLAKSV